MVRAAQIEGLLTEKIEIAFIHNIDPLAVSQVLPSIADLRNENLILYRNDFGVEFNEHLIRLCTLAGFKL